MRSIAKEDRTPALIESLLDVWEGSVRATHLFLSDDEINLIKAYVPDALASVPVLIVEAGSNGAPTAFMGIAGDGLEMLFVARNARGRGVGRRLLEHGIAALGVRRLSVNEQNPQAVGFYEHMGFAVCGRSEADDQGNPYPILRMELSEAHARTQRSRKEQA